MSSTSRPTVREQVAAAVRRQEAVGFGSIVLSAGDQAQLIEVDRQLRAELEAALDRLAAIETRRAEIQQLCVDLAGTRSFLLDAEFHSVVHAVHQAVTTPPLLMARRCRGCGCTDRDCSQCVERTGRPCSWVERDLCSACVSTAATG